MNAKSKELTPSLRLLLGGGGLVLIVAGMRATASILSPLLMALVIAVTLAPLLGWLQKKGLPAWLALLVTVVLIVGGGLVLILFMGFAVEQMATEIPTYQTNLDTQKQALESQLGQLGIDTSSITQSSALQSSNVMGVVKGVTDAVVRAIGGGFTMFLILIFLLLERVVLQPSCARNGFPGTRSWIEPAGSAKIFASMC